MSTYDGYRPDTRPSVPFLLARSAETTHDDAAALVWSDVTSILSRTDAQIVCGSGGKSDVLTRWSMPVNGLVAAQNSDGDFAFAAWSGATFGALRSRSAIIPG